MEDKEKEREGGGDREVGRKGGRDGRRKGGKEREWEIEKDARRECDG